jgi:hypothetical protein
MDKPPTKAKPSAFDAEAKALDKRLDQLASDYTSLFLRHPNVEGRPSVEVLEKIQVLDALRVHPWRKKLAAIVAIEINAAFGESHGWLRRMWIEAIAFHVERRCAAAEREAIARDHAIVREAIARDVIATMPADLRTRCPGYPSLHDPDAIQTAAVDVSLKIKTELSLGIHGGDLNAIKIGRSTLTALGYEGRADDLLPTEQRKKKRRERYRKKSSI